MTVKDQLRCIHLFYFIFLNKDGVHIHVPGVGTVWNEGKQLQKLCTRSKSILKNLKTFSETFVIFQTFLRFSNFFSEDFCKFSWDFVIFPKIFEIFVIFHEIFVTFSKNFEIFRHLVYPLLAT